MSFTLRPYQADAVTSAFERWKEDTSTLIVCPTGTGKTSIFAEIARRFSPIRSLIIAHREELIFQAKERLESLNLSTDIEMAEMTAVTGLFGSAKCVLASVQTMHRRLARFDPQQFGLLVIDEFHHATATTYRKVMDHFRKNPDLKILGVTATPDRADEEALGQVMDSVAFDYEILDAINDGWLVPVEQQRVCVKDLDFSEVRTTAGDLNGADLAAVMEQEKNVQGVVGSSIELIGDRQAILFASSVLHAEKSCEIFNRHRGGMATFICGETDKETRRVALRRFLDGETQVLTNVGVATEGFDAPNVSVILVARPTESRSLYAQMAGRGMRPVPGLVDCFADAEERKVAIAQSKKPAILLVDYVGNSGRHKLMSSADILGGKVSEDVLERAKKIGESAKGSVRMVEVLAEAEEQLRKEREQRKMADEARRARLVAKVQYSTRMVNPFDVLDISPVKERGWDKDKVLSEKQRALLLKQGIDGDAMPYAQAKQILDNIFGRWSKKLATFKQCSLLKRHGVNAAQMTMKDASVLIDKIANNHWHFTPDMMPSNANPKEMDSGNPF